VLLLLAVAVGSLGASGEESWPGSFNSGFDVEGDVLSTLWFDTCDGACAFAWWYWRAQPSPEPLTELFGSGEAIMVSREAQQITGGRSENEYLVEPDEPEVRAIVSDLIAGAGPVPVIVAIDPETLHSVLAYAWDAERGELACYDPNYPAHPAVIVRNSAPGTDPKDWVFQSLLDLGDGPEQAIYPYVLKRSTADLEAKSGRFAKLYRKWAERDAIEPWFGVPQCHETGEGDWRFSVTFARGDFGLTPFAITLSVGGASYDVASGDGDDLSGRLEYTVRGEALSPGAHAYRFAYKARFIQDGYPSGRSREGRFAVPPLRLAAPRPIYPLNGAAFSVSELEDIVYSWSPVPQAAHYEFQYRGNNWSMGTAHYKVRGDSIGPWSPCPPPRVDPEGFTLCLAPVPLLCAEWMEWRVRAVSASGEPGEFCAWQRFDLSGGLCL